MSQMSQKRISGGGGAMSALPGGFNRSMQHLLLLPDEEVCANETHLLSRNLNKMLPCSVATPLMLPHDGHRHLLRGGDGFLIHPPSGDVSMLWVERRCSLD